jgi:predicted acylesterase/phospholipase RssA
MNLVGSGRHAGEAKPAVAAGPDGMLQALTERQISPDFVVGTSVGSLNGAVIGLDPTAAAHRLSHAWVHITRHQIFPGGMLAQVRTLPHSETHLFPKPAWPPSSPGSMARRPASRI